MTDDPLAKFRAAPIVAKAAPVVAAVAAPGGKESYKAFASKDRQKSARIDVRPKDGLAHSLSYAMLYEVIYDRHHYTEVGLCFPSVLVKIHGTGLRPLCDAIRLGVCEFVEQFDSEIHETPEDPHAAFVAEMEVISAASVRAGKGG